VRGRRRAIGALAAAGCAALFAAGCGGGNEQTHGEVAHTYKIEVLDITFKPEQAVGKPAKMRIEVRNVDTKTIPNIAVTIDSFYYTEKYPELAANQRPVWVVEQGPGKPPEAPVQSQAVSPPGGGQTAYVNTWALGPLAPNHNQVFEWKVIPVKSGIHRGRIEISAGLAGQAKATLPNGGTLTAKFRSEIAPAPPSRHVDPSTGRVVAGAFSAQP
jgi:hypothetical protein